MVDPSPPDRPGGHRLSLVARPSQAPITAPAPAPLTSFIGREREIANVVALLHRPGVRLLTLTGPGGIGKSRLALSVLERLRDGDAGETAFVELAPVRDPALALPTVAQALDVPEDVGQSLLERVQAFLADRAVLLVLDNLEHLLDGVAPLLVGLLASGPRVKVMATSRVRLGVSGEQVVPLAPLDRETARALFTARAEAAQPSFTVTTETTPVIDAVCDRLDRLPLAIELAAARVTVLPPRALLARLDRRLDLLTGGPHDAPARLRDMREAIAWSHELLPEAERVLFRRLGVFVGGFTLEAAQAVAGAGEDVLDSLTTLVSASLVIPSEDASGEPRFTMLETIRDYALEQLAASGEERATKQAHTRFFVGQAERLWSALTVEGADAMVSWFQPELANLRAALTWSLVHEPHEAVRLTGALGWVWVLFGLYAEGVQWVERALTAAPDAPVDTQARARWAAGFATSYRGDFALAERYLTDAVARARPLPNSDPLLCLGLAGLGGMVGAQGDLARARDIHDEELRIARALGNPLLLAIATLNQGQLAAATGDLPRARVYLEEALDRHRDVKSQMGMAVAHTFLGDITRELGDRASAACHYQDAIRNLAGLDDGAITVCNLEELACTIVPVQPQLGTQLLGAADAARERLHVPRDDSAHDAFHQAVAIARAGLGELGFTPVWEAGRALALDEAIASALQVDVAADAQVAPSPAATHGLTPREQEVLRLLANGQSNRAIAEALCISIPTVKRHVTTILSKLDLPSRSAATAFAHTHHLT